MRIQSMNQVTQAYGLQSQGKTSVYKQAKKDELSVSETGRDFQYAYKLATQVPDIREDKVAAIRERIQSGTYTRDAAEVSEKLMRQIDIQG